MNTFSIIAVLLVIHASCFARAQNETTIKALRNANVASGFDGIDVYNAYGWSTSNIASRGYGSTVAIIIQGDYATAESDLALYVQHNAALGLPACTTVNGCFQKVSSTGGTNYPPAATGQEALLDVQAVHLAAPGAAIILVEAQSTQADVIQAITWASQHAEYVSMSFGQPEFANGPYESTFKTYSQQGISFFAASGDNGVVAYPSVSPHVVAVGATQFASRTGSSGSIVPGTETAASFSGGGCSAYYSAPNYQSTYAGPLGCNNRATPDVSYLGVAFNFYSHGTLSTIGGTSVSCPLFAGRAAVKGFQFRPTDIYHNVGSYVGTMRDITSGCQTVGNDLCAGTGYDLVTGFGSWIN